MHELAERASKLALSPKWRADREGLCQHILHDEPAELVLFLIQTGIERCVSRSRADTRRALKSTVVKTQPDAPRPGGVKYSVVLSKSSKRKLLEATVGLFQQWMVGDTQLGNAYKDQLIAAAKNERNSGRGHLWNAIWYERLATPMNDEQKVSDYWESEEAVALIRDEIWRDAEGRDITFTPPETPPMPPRKPRRDPPGAEHRK